MSSLLNYTGHISQDLYPTLLLMTLREIGLLANITNRSLLYDIEALQIYIDLCTDVFTFSIVTNRVEYECSIVVI